MPSSVRPRDSVRVAALQQSATDDIEANVQATLQATAAAAADGANLVVTQELFAARYFCQTEDHRQFDFAEPIPGPTTDRFSAAAQQHGIVIVVSLFEKRAPGLFHNTAVVIDADGSIAGRYRKMHIPDDPLYYEKFYFTPGDADDSGQPPETAFHAISTSIGRIGIIVCWDQWFPEAARLTALDGAEILCIPTAIGHHPCEKESAGPAQLDAWRTIQRSHAIANGVFVVVANRVGHEPTPNGAGEGINFWGHSFIAGPDGVVIDEATGKEPACVMADCDLRHIDQQRQDWPFLRDRRIDAYAGLTRRWGTR